MVPKLRYPTVLMLSDVAARATPRQLILCILLVSLTMYALLCSGFDNFYYMYSYEDTRDAFAMPHDILILEQVFRCKDGAYAHSNSYWTATYIRDMIAASGAGAEKVAAWTAAFAELKLEYDALARIVDEVSKGIPV